MRGGHVPHEVFSALPLANQRVEHSTKLLFTVVELTFHPVKLPDIALGSLFVDIPLMILTKAHGERNTITFLTSRLNCIA